MILKLVSLQPDITIDQIKNSYKKYNVNVSVFIVLSKAFDNVDHHIPISKIKQYEVKGNNLYAVLRATLRVLHLSINELLSKT